MYNQIIFTKLAEACNIQRVKRVRKSSVQKKTAQAPSPVAEGLVNPQKTQTDNAQQKTTTLWGFFRDTGKEMADTGQKALNFLGNAINTFLPESRPSQPEGVFNTIPPAVPEAQTQPKAQPAQAAQVKTPERPQPAAPKPQAPPVKVEPQFQLQFSDTKQTFENVEVPEAAKAAVTENFKSLREDPQQYQTFTSEITNYQAANEIFSSYAETKDANQFWNNLEQQNPNLAKAFIWMSQVKQGQINPYEDPNAMQHVSELWKYGAYRYATDGFRLDPNQHRDIILDRLERLHLAAMEDGHLDVNDLKLAYSNFAQNLSLDPNDYKTKMDFISWIKSPDTPFLAKAAMVIGLPLAIIGLLSGFSQGFGSGQILMTLLGALGAAYGAYQYMQGSEKAPQLLEIRPSWGTAGGQTGQWNLRPSERLFPPNAPESRFLTMTIQDLKNASFTEEDLPNLKNFVKTLEEHLSTSNSRYVPYLKGYLERLKNARNASETNSIIKEMANMAGPILGNTTTIATIIDKNIPKQ